MRKIGIFGGTFNPIHKAHIQIASEAKKQLGLDFVLVMTGGNPPHKRDEEIPDAKIRHIMVKKAVKDIDFLIPCDWEVNREEFSYSVDTLIFFKKLYPDDEIYFIIGGDSYSFFHKWYKPEEILRLCRLAVYKRNTAVDDAFFKKNNAAVSIIEGEFMDVSSTAVRCNPNAFMNVLPEAVGRFITEYRLYKKNDEDELLRQMLSEARYTHSVNVAEMCEKLAAVWGADCKTAYRMGKLHDIAKNIEYEKAVKMCDELEAELDSVERNMPQLVHPKLGAELVKCYFNIKEGIITSAIRCHTVGKLGMNIYDKILFVADMCETGRSFDGVDEIRRLAFENPDRAVIACIDKTLSFAKSRGGQVHPMAYAVKKEILAKL